MKQDVSSAEKGERDNTLPRETVSDPLICPICLHPIPYSKKFQCRRCGWMPG